MAPFPPEHEHGPTTTGARLASIAAPRPTPHPNGAPQLTNVAMERFSCIADRCEDTCCRDWAVELDRPSLDRLKATVAKKPGGSEKLVRLVVLGRPSPHASAPAHLQLEPDGSCPMLEPNRLCGLQSEFGERALSTTCSVFPRSSVSVDGNVEVGGSLACPEMARLVLLAREGELELKPATRPMLPRPYIGNTVLREPEGGGSSVFALVRGALVRLLRHADYGVGSRLVFAANLADRIDAWLEANTAALRGPGRAFAVRALERELADLEAPPTLAALDQDLRALAAPAAPVAALLATMLLERRRFQHSRRYAALIDDVMRPFRGPELAADQLAAAYVRQRDALDARLGARVRTQFANYAQHYVQQNPYTAAASLKAYLVRFALHLGAIRLMTALHPTVTARLAQPASAADVQAFEDVIVHVTQTYTKAIGHSAGYQEAALRSAEDSGPHTFGRLVLLARFL